MNAIMMINIYLSDIINKKYINYLLTIIYIFTISNEIYIYSIIGNIYHARVYSINECKINSCSNLLLSSIPKKYSKYHIDSNNPSDKSYYTYKYYLQYYELPDDVDISYK